MAINPPIDATKTPAWEALQKHYDQLQSEGIDMRKWFAEDSERAQKLSFEAGDLYFDLSKNLIKPETLELLAALAKDVSSAFTLSQTRFVPANGQALPARRLRLL